MPRWMAFAGGVIFLGVAGAAESGSKTGALTAPRETDEHIEILDATASGTGCAGRGTVCAFSGAPSTRALEAAGVPAFARDLPSTTSAAMASDVRDHAPWTIEIAASLKAPISAGNVVFILYDAADPNAMANHEVAGLYQGDAPAGVKVAARLSLSPNDGYIAGHTYKLRIERILGRREIVLAQGQFTLK